MNTIEQVKDYWNTRPCNIRHSNAPIGTKTYFDQVLARKYFVEDHIMEFAEHDKYENKNVLEIGCGIGTDTEMFAESGAYVDAVDLSEESIKITNQRAKVFGLEDRIKTYCVNAEELSKHLKRNKRYGLIYSFGVIHHSPNPKKIIQEMARFAHSGTELKIMVYSKWSWKVLWILLTKAKGKFWKLDQYIRENSEAQFGSPVTFVYSKKEAQRLVEPEFTIVEMKKRHIFSYKISDYKKFRYKKVWYFRWMPNFLFSWLEKRLGWHWCIKAIKV